MSVSALVSPVWYDDAGHFLVAREVALHGVDCYPVSDSNCDHPSPYVTMGPALTWPIAGWMQVFGENMETARILMVILSLMALFVVPLLANGILDHEQKAVCALFLILGNIQWITYGSELLGEVPMLGWFLLGIWAQVLWMRTRNASWVLLAISAWFMAVLTKEYILFPLGLGLIAWFALSLLPPFKKHRGMLFIQGVVLLGCYFLYSIARAGGWDEMLAFIDQRKSYGSEFMAFDFGEALRYLAYKPLIWIGTIALVIKVRVRRDPVDIFMLCMQAAMTVFFLCSSGYDRFGFQLIPIAAIYFSEYVILLFRRWVKGNWVKGAFLYSFLIAMTWQQTLIRLPRMLLDGVPTNAAEISIVQKAIDQGARSIFTFDQQLAPFIDRSSIALELFATVPSNAGNCLPHQPQAGSFYIEGEYGRSIFRDCILRTELSKVDSVSLSGVAYTLYKMN